MMRKVIVLGCVLAAIAITLKIKLATPQGPQPLARALVITHRKPVLVANDCFAVD